MHTLQTLTFSHWIEASSPYFSWGKIERTRQGHVVYVCVCVSAWMHVSRWQQTWQLSSLQLLLLPWASRQINADESLSKGGRRGWHTSSGLPFNKDYAEEKAAPETGRGLLCRLIWVRCGAVWTAVRDRFCMMQFKQKLAEPSWISQEKPRHAVYHNLKIINKIKIHDNGKVFVNFTK